MNWADLFVVVIIGSFAVIGMGKGFIYTMFRLLSFFVSAFLSVKFYPLVSEALLKTSVYTNIKASIFKNLMLQQQTQVPKADTQAKQAAADAIIGKLQLPGFLKENMVRHMPNPSSLFDLSQVMDAVSGELAKVVVDIIALILLYIIIRIGLIFLRFILQGLAKLPVFKQMDKIGGLSFGALEGLLTIYIIFAVVMLFSASPSFGSIYQAIDNSTIAKFIYQNNFIVQWMFAN